VVAPQESSQQNASMSAAFVRPPLIPGFTNLTDCTPPPVECAISGAGDSVGAAAGVAAAALGMGASRSAGMSPIGGSSQLCGWPYWGSFGISGSMKPVANSDSLQSLTHAHPPGNTIDRSETVRMVLLSFGRVVLVLAHIRPSCRSAIPAACLVCGCSSSVRLRTALQCHHGCCMHQNQAH
jgi:hypothetical protein